MFRAAHYYRVSLLLSLCLAGHSLLAAPGDSAERPRGQELISPQPFLALEYWSYRQGQSPDDPANPARPLWADCYSERPGWIDLKPPYTIRKNLGDTSLWLRVELPPDRAYADAAILFEQINGVYTIYHENRVIYERGNPRTGEYDLWNQSRRLFRLGRLDPRPTDRPQWLVLHFYTHPDAEGDLDLSERSVWIGERYDLLLRSFRRDTPQIVLGSVFIIVGLIALGAYLRRRETGSRVYLGLSLFTLCSGVTTVDELVSLQILLSVPALIWQWTNLLGIVLLPVGILSFYEQVFGPGYRRIIRRLWQFHVVHGAGLVLIVFLLYVSLSGTISFLITAIRIIVMVFWISIAVDLIVLIATTFSSALRGNLQARLFFAGTLIVSVSAIPDFVTGFGFGGTVFNQSFYHWGLLLFMVLLIYIAEQHFEDTRATLMQTRESYERARRELESARLKSLQERMNPHFLFNNLNTIHAMLHVDVASADRALISLAENYRFLIDRPDRQLIPFTEEWQFLDNFLRLHQLRFRDTLRVQMELDGDFGNVQVPPLIFQPIVENALQHGLRVRAGHGTIEVRAARIGRWVRVEFLDNGSGLPKDFDANDPQYRGTLGNIRSRLKFHFQRSALLLRNRAAGGGVRVLMCFRAPRLDANEPPDAAEPRAGSM